MGCLAIEVNPFSDIFNKVNVEASEEQSKAIFEWCLDHAQEFEALPIEFVWMNADESERVFEWDEMLSCLSHTELAHIVSMCE